MDFPLIRLDDSSNPPPHSMLPCDPGSQIGGGVAFSFPSPDHRASSPQAAHPTSQNGFFLPRFGHVEATFYAQGSSSLHSTARPPHYMYCSPRNNTVSGDIHPAVLLPTSTSECFAYATGYAVNSVAPNNLSTFHHEREHRTQIVPPSTTISPPTSLIGSAIPANMSWFDVYWAAIVINGPRMFVPQTMYQPNSQGDKERYVSLATLNPPIIFVGQDSPEWGIPIQRLLSKPSVQLVEGNQPAFTSCGPSICIRVNWPGYLPYDKRASTKDYTHERRIISKAKLATVVARCVKQFMDAMSGQPMQEGSDGHWKLGPRNIKADDIILVSLHHVSQGSWQPQLRLRRPITTNVVDRAIAGPPSADM